MPSSRQTLWRVLLFVVVTPSLFFALPETALYVSKFSAGDNPACSASNPCLTINHALGRVEVRNLTSNIMHNRSCLSNNFKENGWITIESVSNDYPSIFHQSKEWSFVFLFFVYFLFKTVFFFPISPFQTNSTCFVVLFFRPKNTHRQTNPMRGD